MRPAGAFAIVASMLIAGCASPLLGATTTETASTASDGVFSATDVFPGNYSAEKLLLGHKGSYRIGEQKVTLVESALDGADIQIYVIRPDTTEKVPVIVDAGPYFPALEGADLSKNPLLSQFVEHGFAFALLSVRGTGNSGGCMDLMGPDERHDVDQGITWLGEQEWSNGNVGMFGGSYDGSTQWEAASTGNPHLKTIAPIAAIPDLFTFFERNGTYMAWTPVEFTAIYWLYYDPVLYNPAEGKSPTNTVESVPCKSSALTAATSPVSAATGERDPLGVWAARDWRDDVLQNYEGTVYLIQGFGDVTVEPHNAYPFVKRLEEKGLVVKHTLGPWGHEVPWRGDALEALVRWYERWLRPDASVDVGPKAQVLDNAGLWRSETAWPPADATPLALHLTGDGKLSPEPGGAAPPMPVAALVPVPDPVQAATALNGAWKIYENTAAEACPACPTFTLDAAEDLRFAGSPRLQLALTPTGPFAHVAAELFVQGPGGKLQRVGYSIMDLRFAAGDGAARPVVPGQPVVARMEFEPLDAVVPAGSKLVLQLHQGGVALRWPPGPSEPLLLDVSGEKSVLTLDVFERGPDAFHEAPPRVGEGGPR